MSGATYEAPRLLIGARVLDGDVRATRDRALEVAVRFREPESLAVTLVKALDAGAEGVLAAPSPALRAALDELKRAVPLVARLPRVPLEEDLSDEPWLLAASARATRRAGVGAQARAALTSVAQLGAVARGELGARIARLLELGADALGSRTLRGIAITAPVTDLALAAHQATFFERTTRFVRSRFRCAVAFETRNLGHLLAALEEWGVQPDFVIGPVNPRGLGMLPGAGAVLPWIRRARVPVIAIELRAGGAIPLAEGADFALDAGVHGLAPDLVELDDVTGELRALRVAAARAKPA